MLRTAKTSPWPWLDKTKNLKNLKENLFSDFHTLYVLCAQLLVMGEISKDGTEFKNYIFIFSSEEIIKF